MLSWGSQHTCRVTPKYPMLRERAQTYRKKRKLMASSGGRMIRSRSGILCMVETAEEREMGGIASKGQVPLLQTLEKIL